MRRRPSVAETVRIVNNPLDGVEASFHQRGAAFESLLHREVVWVIICQFRSTVFCCCCRCGHVGNALALSIMSIAMLRFGVVAFVRRQ
jgi:hypothetical protein